MLKRQEITIFNNIKDKVTNMEDYIKFIIPNVYVDEQRGVNLKENGTLDVYNIYLSIPYTEMYKNIKEYKNLSNLEKQKFFTLEPKKTYIILGNSEINYSDYETKSEFLDAITNERSCLVQTVDERYHCSKSRWHIEVGAV
jgi:hypothetical protein